MKPYVALRTVVALAVLLAGCKSGKGRAVNVVGSTSIAPFAELLAQEYAKTHPGQDPDVHGGGSTAGLTALADGIADIGMCSRSLTEEEARKFTSIPIARDGLAIVVHPSNRVANLTRSEIKALFAGDVVNWKEVGGRDAPIRLVVREEGSGTREAFVHLVMGKTRVSPRALVQDSNGSIAQTVRGDPDAAGYMSLGLVADLKAINIDGIAPTAAEVLAGRYPLVRDFLFVTKGALRPEAQPFVDFVLSPQGQGILEEKGLVRAK